MEIHPKHAWGECWRPVAIAIDASLDNVNFKSNDAEWVQSQQNQWAYVQKKKYGMVVTPGLVAAGDGLIVKIKTLCRNILNELGISMSRYWNRKGNL
jgi:hypothetical protein